MSFRTKNISLFASSALAGMVGIMSLAHADMASDRIALSSNGSVLLGAIYDEARDTYIVQLKTTVTGEVQQLDMPIATNSVIAKDLSSDGNAVLGQYYDDRFGQNRAFIWIVTGGVFDLGVLDMDTIDVSPVGISGDGKAVTGDVQQSHHTEAFYWTSAGMVGLGTLDGTNSYASAISDDGSTVVGTSHVADETSHAFVWTSASQRMVNIDTLYNNSTASKVSDDGSVVAGTGYNASSNHVFRWTERSGMVDIGTLGGTGINLTGMSGNGNVLIGQSSTTGNAASHAFRYVAETSTSEAKMIDLETLGGTYSYANDLNADGSIVVGSSADSSLAQRGFVWTEATGMITVEEWLTYHDATLDLDTDTTRTAELISADGNVVVGETTRGSSYIARVGAVSGIIDTEVYLPTIAAANNVVVQGGVNSADTIMFGAQGAPMRNRLNVGQRSVWGTIDAGYDNSDQADGGLALGDFGFGYGIADGVTARFSAGATYTKQDLNAGGDVRQRGFYLSPEVSVDLGENIYMTAGGYWGRSSIDSRRGYLNGVVTDYSSGDTNAETWGAKIRFDWLNAATIDETAITPYIGLSYAHTKVDAFTETGGSFPVEFDGSSDHSTIVRLGADFVRPLSDTVRLLAKAELDYQFENHAAATRGTLTGITDFDLAGQDLTQFWVRGGIGAEFDVGKGVASFMVNATTKGQDPDIWLRSNWTIKF